MRIAGYCGDFLGEVRVMEPELITGDAELATLKWKGGRFEPGYPLGSPLGLDTSIVFQVYQDGELVETTGGVMTLLRLAEGLHHHLEVLGVAAHLGAFTQDNVLRRLGGRRVKLSWPASASADVAAYHIYDNRGAGEVNYDEEVATVEAAPGGVRLEELSWTSGQLQDGVWRFGMRAADAARNVADSPRLETDELTIRGFPQPPADVGVECDGPGRVAVRWSASVGPGQ